jgi:hypothetical protein
MRTRRLRSWLSVLLLLSPLACSVSGTVSNGYPPLVEACMDSSDCGELFRCVDGGCEIQACDQTADCPSGLGCKHVAGEDHGQCTFCNSQICPDGG